MESAARGLVVLHAAIPGRLRLRVPGLKGSQAMRRALEGALAAARGVRAATGSVATGTLLILFAPEIGAEAILAAVNAARRRAGAPGAAAPGPVPQAMVPWHALRVEDVLSRLRSSLLGLSMRASQLRLRRYGENILPAAPARDRMEMLLDQFRSLPVALLMGAAALAIFTGGGADAVVVLSVVGLNAAIGFYTEARSERAVRALSRPLAEGATVLRDGRRATIPVAQAVPGDVLELRPGVIVAADARVVDSQGLTLNEATLTGESAPVRKSAEPLGPELALADRVNIVYRGTIVTGGSGRAVVVATGARTEIGQVQAFLGTAEAPQTPLQRQLDRLGRQLTLLAGGACALVFLLGLLRGYGLFATFRNAIALAVAAVPEGLPTLATTTLALGVREMGRRHVLVRRLDAIETLASVRVICLDKTGTLTFNRMSVAEVSCGSEAYLSQDGALRDRNGAAARADASPQLARLAQIVALCHETSGEAEIAASATEAALAAFAGEVGVDVAALRRDHPIEQTNYRTERQLFMLTVHPDAGGRKLIAMKGSPEATLALCGRILVDGVERPLTEELREEALRANARLAGAGQRVLAAAYKLSRRVGAKELTSDFVFVGLIGLADPLRPGAPWTLERLRRAGVSPVMITGDQKATAAAIARKLDLGNGALRVFESDSLSEGWEEADLHKAPHVFARITPAQKLEIVTALQRAGHVVAMTGDGVNDSPALKAADIGVAMGRGGSEAAREVAHIILEDDDLRSLIPAIEQGRATQANIRRAIRYLLATNMSEILLMLLAPAANLGNPLTPAQLLWINLVTDVAPALALGLEPPHHDVMRAPPMAPDAHIVNAANARALGVQAGVIAAGSFAAYVYGCARYGVSPRARSIAFTSLVAAQLLHALSCRSSRRLFASRALPVNRALLAVVAGSFALQGAMMAFAPLRRLAGVAPIGFVDALVALLGAAGPFAFNEGAKLLAGPRAAKEGADAQQNPSGDA
ncbi:MAG: HAD-IC family P-type ATPase [Methylocystis sp.]|uniref:cation-translocating P-type ATPase n=1 Tax=Methylocystis sp. TaxID=1911079 RepID=UPI003DA3EEB3